MGTTPPRQGGCRPAEGAGELPRRKGRTVQPPAPAEWTSTVTVYDGGRVRGVSGGLVSVVFRDGQGAVRQLLVPIAHLRAWVYEAEFEEERARCAGTMAEMAARAALLAGETC